ncbi:MAG: hypothetical protein HON94_00185 [Methylococcales bacterium]|jgi:hypothetical protein|nr:hypothetical protein [Methylococcales bacterium]MBT7408697.1 hypothetical protein [Methylococcales bacterium]
MNHFKSSHHAMSYYSKGFSIISTIFTMVILASISAYIVKISALTHTNASLSARKTQVYYSAISGQEWVTKFVRDNGVCPTSPTTLVIPNVTVQVVVTCSRQSWVEINTYGMFNVSITASQSVFGSVDYISQTIQDSVWGGP